MKKIVFSLFIFLLVGTTAWSRSPHKRIALNGHARVQQPVPFVIPIDYLILGGHEWGQRLESVDNHLNYLHEAFRQANLEHLDAAQQAYGSYLESYFIALTQDIVAIRGFFLFAHRLGGVQRIAIASRLLSVASEHNQFWGVEHYFGDLMGILGYAEQDLQALAEETLDLEEGLSDMLPHEADDMVEDGGD